MAYTSKAQITTRWGATEVTLSADRDPQDGVADDAAIAAACADASSLIDSYLVRAGYTVPLDPVDDIIVGKASDIAVYMLSQQPGGAYTTEKRQRYEDALAWLDLVADKTVELPGSPDANKVATGARAGGFPLGYQARHLRGGGLM